MLERECTWNESSGEWDLRCVAYTGNNMRKVNADEEEDQMEVSAHLLLFALLLVLVLYSCKFICCRD